MHTKGTKDIPVMESLSLMPFISEHVHTDMMMMMMMLQ